MPLYDPRYLFTAIRVVKYVYGTLILNFHVYLKEYSIASLMYWQQVKLLQQYFTPELLDLLHICVYKLYMIYIYIINIYIYIYMHTHTHIYIYIYIYI